MTDTAATEMSRLHDLSVEQGKRIAELEEDFRAIQDMLHNGIKYEQEDNKYCVVWTAREIEKARKQADKMIEKLGISKEIDK